MNKTEALKILEIEEPYTEEELKKKYRTLARKNHPDVVGSEGTSKFIKVKKAYEYLSVLRTVKANNLYSHSSIFTIKKTS